MSGFKGTKGKWMVVDTDVVIAEDEATISFVAGCIDDSHDASLIAAAPELLEALIDMVAIVKKNTYPTPDKPSSNWGRMEVAEQVIAKALGEKA